MSNILFLSSQYELLEYIAEHLSTLDLFHLALTCSELYKVIRESEPIFNHLKRLSLCDGKGLIARQEFQGIYKLREYEYSWRWPKKRCDYDEELEVRVWNLKCDAANPLPCLRCGINVCEECRYVPRVEYQPRYLSCRRPHLNPARELEFIICYCASCDKKVESELPLSLSEYCDCDRYTRWICLTCNAKESRNNSDYFKTRTKSEWELEDDMIDGMWLTDHQRSRVFWCPCGERAPKLGNMRCSWCKRRHNLDIWMDEDPDKIPAFDEDPCYPKTVFDQYGEPIMYPSLGYSGPIYDGSAENVLNA